MIEISWELSYCRVSIMSFLEPSALLVWLVPTLGIYSWADVAAEEAAHRLYLFVFHILPRSLSLPPPLKKKEKCQTRRTGFAYPFPSPSGTCTHALPHHAWRQDASPGPDVHPEPLLTNVLKHAVSTASQTEIGVSLG